MNRFAIPISASVFATVLSLAPIPIAGSMGIVYVSPGACITCWFLMIAATVPIQAWSLWRVIVRYGDARWWSGTLAGVACPVASAIFQTVDFVNVSHHMSGTLWNDRPITAAVWLTIRAVFVGVLVSLAVNVASTAITRRRRRSESQL